MVEPGTHETTGSGSGEPTIVDDSATHDLTFTEFALEMGRSDAPLAAALRGFCGIKAKDANSTTMTRAEWQAKLASLLADEKAEKE
jgi:hypothetical protein